MPKKMRRGAIRSTLSALVRDGQLVLLDQLEIEAPNTKAMRGLIEALVGGQSALIVVTAEQKVARKSVSNLANAHSIIANNLNVRDLLKYDKVIMPLDALDVVKGIWGKGALRCRTCIYTDVIRRPVITEKSTELADRQNKYVFEVARNANKIQVKEAVEEIFELEGKVIKVNMMVMPAKRGRRGRNTYIRSRQWKKAVVTLEDGVSIELFNA